MPVDKSKEKKAKKYAQELTDNQWQSLAPLLPKPKKQTGKAGRFPLDLRQVINAILYIVKTGCQWGMLPKDYPDYKSVYHYYNTWSKKASGKRLTGS